CDKLIYRHPHIYGTTNVNGADQVLQNWEQLKLKEKGGNKRVLAGVPDALPSTIKAFRIQEKAAHVGFDWDTPEGALDKVKEEYAELKQEISAHDKEKAESELGDLLFSIINVARLYKIHPDDALERTNKKFIRRFNYVEEAALNQGKQLKDMTLEEMDALWNEAKAKGL
ncbi:MAG: MazG family protein, partial [Bacteroidaceae bacterium]|nr:MazG family protein [Bacteroidaceae bacterium]